MFTRRMTTRITIFDKVLGQNDDGEVLEGVEKDIVTVWAEVQKTSVKDFKQISRATNGTDGLSMTKDTKVFLIRYMSKINFDDSMYIRFNGLEYKITSIEVDYAGKEYIMIGGVRVS